jgi:hypothetical protein
MSILKKCYRRARFIEKCFFNGCPHERERYFLYRKGDFAKEKDKYSRQIWQKQGNDLFLSCPSCGNINRLMLGAEGRLNHFSITPNGLVGAYENHCINCPICKVHFSAKLRGWKEDE